MLHMTYCAAEIVFLHFPALVNSAILSLVGHMIGPGPANARYGGEDE